MQKYDNKREQFQKLGIPDPETPHTQPPPTFPPRTSKPVVVEEDPFVSFHLIWHGKFLNHLRRGPYRVSTKKVEEALPSMKELEAPGPSKPKKAAVASFRWDRIPNELYRIYHKKRPGDIVKKPAAAKKAAKPEAKLEQLEEKELAEGLSPKPDNPKSDSEAEDEEDIAKDDEENDEEEFDYGNNYFDNGEGFQDEDDNLDDGPLF